MSFSKKKQKLLMYPAAFMLTAALFITCAPASGAAAPSEDFLSSRQIYALSEDSGEPTKTLPEENILQEVITNNGSNQPNPEESLDDAPESNGILDGAVLYIPETEPEVKAVSDAETQPQAKAVTLPGRSIDIYIDGKKYEADAFLYNSITYVGLRRFSNTMGADVSWDENIHMAYVKSDKLSLSAANGGSYINANGRYLWCKEGTLNIGGTLYVPVRQLCQAFGGELYWDSINYSVHITSGSGGIVSGDNYYNSNDLYWLSRIINSESGTEPLKGKVAVGNVVLNRVRSNLYPGNIYDVIFDNRFGVQFSPTANGTIYNVPNEESIIAAKLCLDGAVLSDEILYFINPRLASNFWVVNTCTFVTTIGNHDFYS